MSDIDNPRSHQDDEDRPRSAPGGKSTEHDPAGEAMPPGNPESDREAVERAKEQLEKVSGR